MSQKSQTHNLYFFLYFYGTILYIQWSVLLVLYFHVIFFIYVPIQVPYQALEIFTQVTSLAECTRPFGRKNKSKLIHGIQASPEEESDTIEEQSVAVAKEQVPSNPTVDGGGTNAVAEDDATPVATIASKNANTVLNTAIQSLLDDMNDNINEGEIR